MNIYLSKYRIFYRTSPGDRLVRQDIKAFFFYIVFVVDVQNFINRTQIVIYITDVLGPSADGEEQRRY